MQRWRRGRSSRILLGAQKACSNSKGGAEKPEFPEIRWNCALIFNVSSVFQGARKFRIYGKIASYLGVLAGAGAAGVSSVQPFIVVTPDTPDRLTD